MTTVWHRSELAGERRSGREKALLLVEVTSTYVRVRWLLARKGLRPTVAQLRAGTQAESGPVKREQQIAAVRLGFVVGKVLEPLPLDSRCLMRSLVVTAMLARRRIASSVVIGVRPEPAFAAHAWVEIDGVAVLPPGRYGRVVEV
jgi:hypothetical protein